MAEAPLKFLPGYLNVIGAREEKGRETLMSAIRMQMTDSVAEREAALLVWVDGKGLAIQAQRALASVVKPDRIVTILQPVHPDVRGVAAYLRDYLTKPGAKKFNAVYVDASTFYYHPLDKAAMLDFANELRALLKQLDMYGFVVYPLQEPSEQNQEEPA